MKNIIKELKKYEKKDILKSRIIDMQDKQIKKNSELIDRQQGCIRQADGIIQKYRKMEALAKELGFINIEQMIHYVEELESGIEFDD
ncbi:hypothetical protein KI743_18275 [Vibrio sp. D420a]|uniref:hypothetical protein n=1 Tax=Vibrio sp. D420a TaxID=2836895 RepID=UPI0025551BFB|nr:hypothetical protein [Vibrio sp. D420a]MDK9763956.1 hypothetical protein [Vibrio sp. D420a]